MLNTVLSLLLALLSAAGCGPKYTYPSSQVAESVESVAQKDYKIEVSSRVSGTTLGALYYVDDILDDKGQIPRDIHEKMGQIMQVVTRVGLSTDRNIDFCVVVIRDRAHKNELVITRSLDDTKRANSDAIGVEESINRTLFGQGKYQLNDQGEKSFVLKEVTLESFLAEQIAQRIRFNFAKSAAGDEAAGDGEESDAQQPFVLVDGAFHEDGAERLFRFSVLSLKADEPDDTMRIVLRTLADVLNGYQYMNFSAVEVLDYLNRQKLALPKQIVLDFFAKKISEQEILDKYVTESQTIQEAFKLFGFNLSDVADADAAAPPIAAATP